MGTGDNEGAEEEQGDAVGDGDGVLPGESLLRCRCLCFFALAGSSFRLLLSSRKLKRPIRKEGGRGRVQESCVLPAEGLCVGEEVG